jgi:hypothetical protein
MGTGERRAAQDSSQSVHSSEEAGNDRGAKGRRKMERRRRHMSEQNLSAMTPAKEPKQDKEALRERWQWVERTVWTDPMLRTLETGIKGGRKGKATGVKDPIRWRNRFFDEAGLFNLTTARVRGPIAPKSITKPRNP